MKKLIQLISVHFAILALIASYMGRNNSLPPHSLDCSVEFLKNLEKEINSHENRTNALNKIFEGRHQYAPKSLCPKPFSGFTIMYHLAPTQKKTLGVDLVDELLIQPLVESGLEKVVAFVEPTFYHITTFYLIHQMRRSLFEQERVDFDQLTKLVAEKAKSYLEQLPHFSFHGTVNGVGTLQGKYIVLELTLKPEDQRKITAIRKQLNAFLCKEVKGYQLVNGAEWEGAYDPHITLGYVVNMVPSEKHETFLSILRRADTYFKKKEITFDLGKVFSFSDMDSFVSY